MRNRFDLTLVLALCVCWTSQLLAEDKKQSLEQAERHFTLNVLPVLTEKCLGCHGGDPSDIKGQYQVTSLAHLLAGGESEEPSIVPGKPDEGTLMEAITWNGLEMPPKENDRLSEKQVTAFRRWIQQGAVWPNAQKQQRYRTEETKKQQTKDGILMPTSGGVSEQWTGRRYEQADVWAWVPVPPITQVLADNVKETEAIDFFIDRQLADNKIAASAKASPHALLRRATYDLTGLPPTPQEIEDFEAAWNQDSTQAWSDLIERLLASPRYGEHWGRHWLDVTRYADTGGMSNDFERSNMWRYRDYVIRAFNQDKPYDQFIIEQLAGDELADQSVMNRKGGGRKVADQTQLEGDYNQQEAEWIVATGFLRLGPWDNAMIEPEEARQIYLDDLVNITGQTFLATTMRCCKCHDHKFDPIPTRDYYRMYAAFSTTQMAERAVPLLPSESRDEFDRGEQHVRQMLDFAVSEKTKLVEKRESAARKWFQDHDLPYKNASERQNLPDEKKPPRHIGLDYVDEGQLKVREQDEWIWNRRLERYQPLAQSVWNANFATLAWNGARKLRINRNKKPTELTNHILIGGALTALGDRVSPGVLSAVALMSSEHKSNSGLITDSVNGRRLELARWIANPDNPLTTRSIANRIWQYHFGVGIAANANNFGAKGGKPTHPELLDFLAATFVQNGWSFKQMHRLIMMSDAYQRSTQPSDREHLAIHDPNNRLLSHFPRRRLTAEELRDSVLAITGELQDCQGGLPVMPEINMEVALQPRMIQFSLAPAYQPSPTPQLRNRRTVYAYHVRGQADPFTEIFNQPGPNESCERRESAAVTPQVFTLLNSDLMTDRSIAFAQRIRRETKRLPDQIERAFQLALGRMPHDHERIRMKKYVRYMQAYHRERKPRPVEYPTFITRSLVEEFSGKPFQYKEILPVFENYQPDTKPSDVSAEVRALADLCLLLFNTNEFMYVE